MNLSAFLKKLFVDVVVHNKFTNPTDLMMPALQMIKSVNKYRNQ